MRNSNKVLLTVIICFLMCPIFVVAMVRANLISNIGKNVTKNFNISDFSELDAYSGPNRSIIPIQTDQ